jgi:TfoX/Sxy family transcriptional regulator of competence genes
LGDRDLQLLIVNCQFLLRRLLALAQFECDNPRMAKSAATAAPAEQLALYEKLVSTNPAVERKGAAMPYTSVGGHMFSFLTPTGTLALRLPAQERDAFRKKYKTKLCEQRGTVLKEYVEVPDALLKNTRQLKKHFDVSYAYVASLKPKPTKKAGKNQPGSEPPR